MPDSLVRGTIQVVGAPQAIAQLQAYRAELTAISGSSAKTTLGVNTSALTAAKAEVASLNTVHQALAAKPATLGIDISQITAARGAVQGLDSDVTSLAASLSKLAAPAALASIGVGVTKLASDFQTLTTNIQNNTTASNADIAGMNATIRQLSTESGASLTSLAGGWTHAFNIMGNGADAAKVLSVAMESAVSTGADVSATTDALAKTIHQFGDSANDAAKDMDILHLAAAMGNTTLEQFIDASAKSMVTAASLGVSLKDVSSAYVALTRSGFDAGEANTQIAALLTHLIKPSAEAKAAIADLAKTTGVDLTSDFTLAGVQAKGLVGVLGDIRDATNGQEDAVLKLIPAQRGGIGALALTTSAYKDATEASQQFNRVLTGELTPTADAYTRTQATLGNQAAVLGQQFKQLGVDLGSGAVGPLTDLLHTLNSLPDGVKKTATEIALAGLAIKAASVAADFLVSSTVKLGASIAGDTAVVNGETAAITANTAAWSKNATTRSTASLQALKTPMGEGEVLGETVIAGSAAAKRQVAMDAEIAVRQVETAGAAATIGKAVTGIGASLGRLIVPVSIGLVAYEIIGKPVEDAIRQKVSEIERPQVNLDTLNTDDEAAFEAGIKARIDKQQQIVDEYQKYKGSAGYKVAKIENLGGELQSDRDYKNALANIEKLKAAELDYQQTHHNTVELGPPLPPNYKDAVVVAAAGPSDAEIKKHDEEVKAAAVDVANFQKFQIQQVSDAQVAAATKSADAWKAASAEVQKVDLGKGLQSLIDAAPGLDKVQLDLAMLGQNDQALDNLDRVADRFKAISDAEKQATATYRGFLLTLDETDKRVSAIDALRQRLLAAVDAAQQSKLRGTATASDEAVIAGAPAAFAQLNSAEVQLKGNAGQDWAGIIADLPEWLRGQLQADSSTRAAVGDGKQLLLSVEADKTKAAADLDAFEKEDRKAIVKITADTKDAIASIDALIKSIPTSIPLLITTPQGAADPTRGYGDSNAPPPANPAGWNQYQPLSMGQYSSIVKEGAGGKASPFDDPTMYAAVLAAAQQYGVDPRVLLAFTKAENNNATNISASLLAANNYGGIKGPGGPVSPEGDTYRAFASPEEFFKALAANLSTGAYAGDYQSGNLNGVAQRYVGGPSPGRVEDYARYASQYPAGANADPTRGYGSGGVLPGYGPGDVGLGSSQNPTGGALNLPSVTGGSSSSALLADAQKHLGDKFDRFGQDVYGRCEEIVDDIMQEVTGTNTRFPSADAHVRAAMAGQPGAGTVVSASQARAGDLVGWTGASAYAGSPDGHIGVYSGNNNYIGTTRQGVQERPIGPDAVFIRPDGVVAGGAEPGATLYKGTPSSRATAGYGPGTYTSTGGTSQASTQTLEQLAAAVAHVDEKGALLKQTLATLTPKDFSATISQFNTMGAILDKIAHAGDSATTTETTKIQESADALAKNIDLTNLWAQGLAVITNKSGDLAAIEEKISSTVGGPLAANLNQQLSIMSDQAAIADRINSLTARKASLEAAATATATARQAQDTAESRSQTRQSWADQDVDTGLANRGRAENTRYTGVSREEEDRQRALQFSQQLAATDLQNKLTDLQKSQQSTVYQRTSQEQLVSAQAAGASTNQGQGVLSARLAAMHEQDLKQKDLDTKAIDGIQLQIREQAKQANLESYNLETERIAEQRKHEDILQGITDEGVANTATRQARDRSHQQDLWNIQDARTAEDARSAAAITAINNEIQAQQTMASAADANLKAAQDALTFWQQTGIAVQAAVSYLNAVPVSGPNTIRRLDGHAAGTMGAAPGWALVGEQGPELVNFRGGEVVKSNPATMRALRGYAGGTGDGSGLSISIGSITIGSQSDDEAIIAEATRRFQAQLRAGLRDARMAGRKQRAAVGAS